EVSFNRIAPRADEIWTHSTADGIDLPIGRAGAARLQFMRLGRGTSQHVLIAGKTGSGKSTFLHILITNLALHYSPNEIQFYLIDFKKGVEFRTYAANKLPHARVVAIESDREFGLSVLERLDEVLQERGELFRDRGVQDVPSFRTRFPAEPMPRLLLLIDEFQEFFTAEDRVSARASLLLDRLVRQGRAFGIHVLLGSQTLGGAYSLARSTMGQIAVRIALQCSESDAHLILSEDNMAARMLTRPGEAIYNDANGLVQGNHQFQVAWLDEARREEGIQAMLSQPRNTADTEYRMIVFEGNVAPTAELCAPLNVHLARMADATRRGTDAVTIWLGEPVAIAAPTCIELRRASGQNILIVGQDEAHVDSLIAFTILSTSCGASVVAAAAGVPAITMLHDGRDKESLQKFVALQQVLGTANVQIQQSTECDSIVESIYNAVVAREENAELSAGPEHVLIVRNIGQFRSLRKEEDDFGLGSYGEPKKLTVANMLGDILKRGPLVGIHVVVWSDTFNNAVRWLSNSLLREFENRIAFRMNQTDSASLVDNPVAASLAQGRALVYRDQTGTTEKFRPFAWPSQDWLRKVVGSEAAVETTDLDIDSLKIE
ncbi:MAG: FtsK/SpoIIIE domain-containing protein, partial [Fuerstiella sp.]